MVFRTLRWSRTLRVSDVDPVHLGAGVVGEEVADRRVRRDRERHRDGGEDEGADPGHVGLLGFRAVGVFRR
ncbi:hypothetical protein SDC9_103182 [bioreactor metagenome]|uniref:Uncharacterized protein n=1 Tax=bioreactor metagenome TaxID=1076179 RepID=A0A645ATD2_9ZZZZ